MVFHWAGHVTFKPFCGKTQSTAHRDIFSILGRNGSHTFYTLLPYLMDVTFMIATTYVTLHGAARRSFRLAGLQDITFDIATMATW